MRDAMSGSGASKPPAIEEPKLESPSSDLGRKPPSILGLSIVSGLNLICLGFIAFHFVGHPDEPASAEPPQASEVAGVATPPKTQAIVAIARKPKGNVDFLPAPKHVLSIASHIDGIETVLAKRRTEGETVISAAATPKNPQKPPKHWVQLGALSEEASAKRYWSDLKARHESLFRDQEPRYFGPSDVGGGLYHIRLGPMASEDATAFCRKLKAQGADCFRVNAHD